MEISHVHFIQVTDKYCPSGASNIIVPVYLIFDWTKNFGNLHKQQRPQQTEKRHHTSIHLANGVRVGNEGG